MLLVGRIGKIKQNNLCSGLRMNTISFMRAWRQNLVFMILMEQHLQRSYFTVRTFTQWNVLRCQRLFIFCSVYMFSMGILMWWKVFYRSGTLILFRWRKKAQNGKDVSRSLVCVWRMVNRSVEQEGCSTNQALINCFLFCRNEPNVMLLWGLGGTGLVWKYLICCFLIFLPFRW